MWSVFVDNDGHKRGQTSRPVIGVEIQTYCNFEAHIYRCRYLLGSIQCRCFLLHVRSSYNHLVWSYSCTTMLRYLNCVVHKNFLRSKSSSCTNTRSCSTAEPTKCIEYHKIQKGSVQCTVGSVGISCLLFAVWFTGNCNQTKQNLFMVTSHHEGCSRHINFLKLNVKSVSVLLENKWSETSSKANDQTRIWLSIKLDATIMHVLIHSKHSYSVTIVILFR